MKTIGATFWATFGKDWATFVPSSVTLTTSTYCACSKPR